MICCHNWSPLLKQYQTLVFCLVSWSLRALISTRLSDGVAKTDCAVSKKKHHWDTQQPDAKQKKTRRNKEKKKRNHSKSAHISQRSFLYWGEFVDDDNKNRGDVERRNIPDERRENEAQHQVDEEMKETFFSQWEVRQLRIATFKCLMNLCLHRDTCIDLK